ncbi:MAG: hypothetical protein AAF570_17845, partial [Bacteroidota bacterium]
NNPISRLYIIDQDEPTVYKGYQKRPMDLNKGAGGKDIWLTFSRATKREPVTDIQVNGSPEMSGYTSVENPYDGSYNLNASTDDGDRIYMHFSRDPDKGDPIMAVDVVDKGNTSGQEGWVTVDYDLNKGENGSNDLYLIYSREEITLTK